jgi:hypothetical protein
MSNLIIWDIETVPDLKGFAAANGHHGRTDDEIRAAVGEKFPKHVYHLIICIGALVAHRGEGSWKGRLPADQGRRTFEEKRDRHLQNLGYLLQAAGAHAVPSFLVFLDLLECQPEGVPEIGLAHIEHEPPTAHATANMLVDRIGSAAGHWSPHWLQIVEFTARLAGHHAAKKRKLDGSPSTWHASRRCS